MFSLTVLLVKVIGTYTPMHGTYPLWWICIYEVLHTLGVQGVNHKQLPYGAFCMDYIYEVWVLILPIKAMLGLIALIGLLEQA